MAKFKTSVSRNFGNIQYENDEVANTIDDNVFYMHSKYIYTIFEDSDSDISDEEEYKKFNKFANNAEIVEIYDQIKRIKNYKMNKDFSKS